MPYEYVHARYVGPAQSSAWRGSGDWAELAGTLDGDNCHGAAKVERLKGHLASERCDPLRIVAYSDHHSDLPLLAFADTAYVVNPRRAMRRLAEQNGFVILRWSQRPEAKAMLSTMRATP